MLAFAKLSKLAGLFGVAIALTACSDAAAPPEKQRVRVLGAQAAPGNYAPKLSLTGVVLAQTESNLSFRTGGRVAERLADVGDRVQAGQVLARLDTAEQQSDVRSAEAAVDSAQAQVTQTAAALERQQTLLARGFTTKRDFDQAKQAADVASSSLESAQSQLQNARDALGYTELKADKPGIVTARSAEAGQVVQAAQTIFTVAEDGGRDAVFDIAESAAANPPPQQDIIITLLSNPAITAKGQPREIAPVVDPATGTIRIKIGIIDPPAGMDLGAAVSGTVTLRQEQAVTLPWQALFSDAGRPAVWTVDRATNAVRLQPVGVLAYDTGSVAIRSGLSGGELVVVAGGQLLRPGLVVDVVQEPAK